MTTSSVSIKGVLKTFKGDRDYGIVVQDAVLYDWRTVAKNIALPLELGGRDRKRRQERVNEMLELVELTGFENHHPWQLSGGMQKRVSIAPALSFDRALLLMDEPIEIDLPQPRVAETREEPRFFELVIQAREARHAGDSERELV